MTARYCDHCGSALGADALFCASCGAPRPAEAPAPTDVRPAPPSVRPAPAPVAAPAPPPVSASAPGYLQPAPPPISASAPGYAQPAPPPLSASAPGYADQLPPPTQPAPPAATPPYPQAPVPPSWPAAASPTPPPWLSPASPGAVPGWNAAAPPRRRGRGSACLILLLLLAATAIVGLAALGGAFDNRPSGRGTGDQLPAATKPLGGTITLGAEQSIGSETSDPGSNVTLTAPAGGPAAGLALRIPAEAYAAPVEFALTARPVTVAGYGGRVTALSDLITVDNGGAYAASPMTVTVPVTIPQGMFAMGFFRRDDGTLEAMPLVDETPTSVTVATRHFSSFLIVAIAEAALPANIGTGFRAREDDFQSPNYGSFIAPGGHCAGQSLAAMWYFLERRSHGAPPLWGLTDNNGRTATLPFWQDDANAYRLASSVQRDTNWTNLSARLQIWARKADLDRLQWDAFRYAMLVTGEPQYVGLSQTDTIGGHALVGYAATPSGLWVADPNFPGKLRTIAWNAAAKRFDPYASGPTAAESDHMYDLIGLMGKTALVDWDAIGARWAEVDAGTIGGDRFPGATIIQEVTAADGTITTGLLTSGSIDTRKPWLGFTVAQPGATLRATFYNGTRVIRTVGAGKVGMVPLADGTNDLGVYIEGLVDAEWSYVDFQRFDLVAPAVSGAPADATEPPEPTEPPPTPTEPPPPTLTPGPTYDCSKEPEGGIEKIDWSLHCQAIQP